MAHEIAKQIDGVKDAFARTEDSAPAWHETCGIVANLVPAGSNATTLGNAAGLFADVQKESTFTSDGQEAGFATVRTADRKVFGPVGRIYTVFPMTSLAAIGDRLQAAGYVSCDTAMALRNGAVGCFNLRVLGAEVEARKGDRISLNIALAQAFDGTMRVSAVKSAIRAVCNNTLSAAVENAGEMWQARHTTNVEEAVKAIEAKIVESMPKFQAMGEKYRQLAETPFTVDDFTAYVSTVYPAVKTERKEGARGRGPTLLPSLVERFQRGIGNSGKTAWDAYNAITEHTTHAAGRTAEARQESLLNGKSRDVNASALDLILAESDRILQVVRADGTVADIHTVAAEGLTLPDDGHSMLDYLLG